MPTYVFFCEKCNKSFELVMKISEYEKEKSFRCPTCKSTRVRQEVSAFQTKTSRKS
jgi:putative FmdB family regulatory protein